jgi:ABC-type transport system substrate-binding protein
MYRYLAYLCLFIVIVPSFTACGRLARNSETLTPDQTLILPVPSDDYATLDPALVSTREEIEGAAMLFTGLVTLNDHTLTPEPEIAKYLPTHSNGGISPDGQTYTFSIRPHITFSNGDPVTATTFAYTIERALNPIFHSSSALQCLGGILNATTYQNGKNKTLIGTDNGLTIVDPLTLIIHLSQPDSGFLSKLACPAAWAVNELVAATNPQNTAYTPHWTASIGGTGPFVLANWTHYKAITFEPNHHWYGKPLTLKRVIRPFIPSISNRIQEYGAQTIDATTLPAEEMSTARLLPFTHTEITPLLATISLKWHAITFPFDHPAIRQILLQTLDRSILEDVFLNGTAKQTTHIIPSSHPAYNPYLDNQLPYLMNKTQQIETLVGTSLILHYEEGNLLAQTIALKIQAIWQMSNILDIILEPVSSIDAIRYKEELNPSLSQLDLLIPPITQPLSYWPFITPIKDLLSAPAISQTDNAIADTIIHEALGFYDPIQRNERYHEAETLAITNVSDIPLAQQMALTIIHPWIYGYMTNALGYIGTSIWPEIHVFMHDTFNSL